MQHFVTQNASSEYICSAYLPLTLSVCVLMFPKVPVLEENKIGLDQREVHQVIRELTNGILNQTHSISLEALYDQGTWCNLPPGFNHTHIGKFVHILTTTTSIPPWTSMTHPWCTYIIQLFHILHPHHPRCTYKSLASPSFSVHVLTTLRFVYIPTTLSPPYGCVIILSFLFP